jgi:hypothetical protein
MSEEEQRMPERVLGAVGEILTVAKESPDAREAGATAGKSLLIISRTIHNVLLPLAVVNYGVRKFEDYIKNRFSSELNEALADVPEDDIGEPSPMIAGPALQALVYAHEEPSVRALFVQLMAASMSASRRGKAHPAFVEIIKQLDPLEVSLLENVLRFERLPVVQLRSGGPHEVFRVLHRYVVPLVDDDGELPFYDPFMEVYLTNWVRLGLIEIDFESRFPKASAYDFVRDRPEYEQAMIDLPAVREESARAARELGLESKEDDHGGVAEPVVIRGRILVTPWGKQFASSVGIVKES